MFFKTQTFITGVMKQKNSLHTVWCARRRRRERQTEKEGGVGSGLSFLGDQTAPPGSPLKAEFLHKLFVFSVQLLRGAACHSTRQSHHARPPLRSLSSPPWLQHSRHCSVCSINMWHMSLTSREDPSPKELGSSVNHVPPPLSPFLILPPLFHSRFLNIELPG